MAQVLIRNIDDEIVARLKLQAAEKNVSLEQLLRNILTDHIQNDCRDGIRKLRVLRENVAPFDFDFTAAIRSDRDAR